MSFSPFLLHAAGLPLSESRGDVYHILHNGSDTRTCGKSAHSACASLQHVLGLYFAKPPTKRLEIITGVSLQFNKATMVRKDF